MPKKAEGGQFDPSCSFPKNVSSKERVEPCFSLPWNLS